MVGRGEEEGIIAAYLGTFHLPCKEGKKGDGSHACVYYSCLSIFVVIVHICHMSY